ncbi:NBR1-Ig-like domain-containing protein [Micromonospora sp. KC723]|uniref:NBR1-Ig-like domain-containing protein n=1 Tax=Micromonospora sp. KC723 TaxID=2530381 RepID=UPI0010537982|nr:NBR1-Ig-like domain-containing protein [Micromonospora sp. KC723]TDB76720.1 transcriptional regulator [Micromonospora sp. KC723]
MGAFADRLWRLKQEAGDPSYEEMSVRLGAAASKSSLAAAAQGRTLPSWETTWEFVRVLAVDRLGHDPMATEEEWRQRWTRVRAAQNPTDAAPTAGTVPAADTGGIEQIGTTGRAGDGGGPGRGGAAPAVEPSPRLRGHRHIVAAVAAALAVLAGAVVVFVVGDRRTDSGDVGGTAAAAVTPDHDDSQFEGDVTYPDGTLVPPNSSFTKIWRIRNTGTVIWANRLLARVNEDPCETPRAVPIPQTRPGEVVDIAVPVRTPGTPGTCKIYWKMADEQGRTLFPLKRPVFLDVRVGSS